jgi:hypothetical protein
LLVIKGVISINLRLWELVQVQLASNLRFVILLNYWKSNFSFFRIANNGETLIFFRRVRMLPFLISLLKETLKKKHSQHIWYNLFVYQEKKMQKTYKKYNNKKKRQSTKRSKFFLVTTETIIII